MNDSSNKNNQVEFSAEPLFIISRILDCPREFVWRACSEPERMQQWWGPKGFSVRIVKMDFSLGGVYHCCLNSPDGQEIWGKFVYCEIVAPKRIVFVNCFSNEKEGITRHPMNSTWPLEILSTYTFVEQSGKTIFNIQCAPICPTESERKSFEEGMDSMKQGWNGTLDQLAEYLAKAQDKDMSGH